MKKEKNILILASGSPRRKKLLEEAGLCFSVIISSVDESLFKIEEPLKYVQKLAEAKAADIADTHLESWVIGADTAVLLGEKLMEKPKSYQDAFSMLKLLSGKTHKVLTGYCIINRSENIIFTDTAKTDVCFKNLAQEEIYWYLNTKDPFDKAGAYGIQGLGSFLVKSVFGSYTNVVGLPVCEVIDFFTKQGVIEDFKKVKNVVK